MSSLLLSPGETLLRGTARNRRPSSCPVAGPWSCPVEKRAFLEVFRGDWRGEMEDLEVDSQESLGEVKSESDCNRKLLKVIKIL